MSPNQQPVGWQLLLALALSASGGCDKPQPTARQLAYRQATTAHYHPDLVNRPPETQPAESRPADFQFGARGAGSPVMVVNGEPVSVADVLEPMIEDLAAKAKGLSEAAYRDYLTQRIIEQTGLEISRVLIYQEARKTFPDKAGEVFAKEADKFVQEVVNARFGGVFARYEAHLKALDLTLADVKERAKRQMMVSQFLHERFKPLVQNPSRAELLKYYHEHEADFTTPEKAELFLIEVPLSVELKKPLGQATDAERAAARERALAQVRRAREEIESGVPFADVARQYSKGLQAALGGAVGEISPGSLTRHWAKAAEVLFTLEEGELSEPIDAGESIFLVRCGKKTPARRAGFEQSQEQIIRRLMDDQFSEMQRKYLTSLEAKATIQRRHEFMVAVFAAAPRPARFEARGRDEERGTRNP
ncbi:MAG: peptidyl-prolyl cis-trans isomerase [Phycisphaerae bacterium]|jgi:hypothetical protein